jgi:hypothetical protein
MVLTLLERLYIYGRYGTFLTTRITPVLQPLKVSRTSSLKIAKPKIPHKENFLGSLGGS